MQLDFIPSLVFYILGILIIAITFRLSLKKQHTPGSNDWKNALEAEHQLEFVRNKSLDTSLFLQIDFKKIPCIENEKCKKHYLSLMRYADLPMINLQGASNLELKKNYGPQVVAHVADYERHYFEFMQKAIRYSEYLIQCHALSEAQAVLELCVMYHCDISKCYLLLIDVYRMQNNTMALTKLEETIKNEMANSPFLHKVLEYINPTLKASI